MAFEEINLSHITSSFTKYSRTCIDSCHLAGCLSDAIRASLSPPMGPSLLELPRDVSGQECATSLEIDGVSIDNYRIMPRRQVIKKAAHLINESHRPLMILGSGAYWSNACDIARKVSRKAGIPVLLNGFAQGCIPFDDNHYVGHAPLGLPGLEPDLLILIGSRWDEFLGFGQNKDLYPPEIPAIQVDIDPRMLGKNRHVTLPIWSDARLFLEGLLPLLNKKPQREEWVQKARAVYNTIIDASEEAAKAYSSNKPIKPQFLVRTLRESLPRNTQYILDGGDITGWGYLYLRASYPGQVMWSHGPLGGIGAGIPISISAKLARPSRRTVLLTGDGSFLMGALEIDTAVRYNIPITIVIADDEAWGDVYHNWLVTGGDPMTATYARLRSRNYAELAESLGAKGYSIDDPRDLVSLMRRLNRREPKEPIVIHVKVDSEEFGPLSQVLLRER